MFSVPVLPMARIMPFSTSIHSAVESLSSTVYMLLGGVHIAYTGAVVKIKLGRDDKCRKEYAQPSVIASGDGGDEREIRWNDVIAAICGPPLGIFGQEANVSWGFRLNTQLLSL